MQRAHGVQLALLPAGRRARPALRLPRARPVRPGARPALQPGEAADRPVREADRRARCDWDAANALPYVAVGGRERRPDDRRERLGAGDAEVASSIDPSFDWQDDDAGAPADPVARHGDLRGARQGLHEAARGRARGPARHVRRARERGLDRVPEVARRHGGRAAARAPHRRRGLPARPRADELLGLLDDRLPRAALAVRRDRATRCASSRGWSRRCTAPASR